MSASNFSETSSRVSLGFCPNSLAASARIIFTASFLRAVRTRALTFLAALVSIFTPLRRPLNQEPRQPSKGSGCSGISLGAAKQVTPVQFTPHALPPDGNLVEAFSPPPCPSTEYSPSCQGKDHRPIRFAHRSGLVGFTRLLAGSIYPAELIGRSAPDRVLLRGLECVWLVKLISLIKHHQRCHSLLVSQVLRL